MYAHLCRLDRNLVKLERALIFGLMIFLVAILTVQVLSRFVFNAPIDYTEELSRFGLIWLVFIGTAHATYLNEHFIVAVLVDAIKFPGKSIYLFLVDLLVILFFVGLIYFGWKISWKNPRIEPALNLSMGWAYLAIPVGCTMALYHLVLSIYRARILGETGFEKYDADHDRVHKAEPTGRRQGGGRVMVWWITLLMVVMIGFRIPIAVALGLSGALYVQLKGVPMAIAPQRVSATLNNALLLALPMFMLAGRLMNLIGATERVFNLALAIIGHIRGGLGYVVVLTSIIFFRHVRIGRRRCRRRRHHHGAGDARQRLRPQLRRAITLSSSTLAPIIPPSIILIVYSVTANASIGQLFLAGGSARPVHRRRPDDHGRHHQPPTQISDQGHLQLPPPADRAQGRVPAAADPGDHHRRHLQRHLHPDRGRRRGGELHLPAGADLPQADVRNLLLRSGPGRHHHRRPDADHLGFGADRMGVRPRTTAPAPDRRHHVDHRRPELVMLIIIGFGLVLGMFMDAVPIILILVPALLPLIDSVGINPIHFGLLFAITTIIGLITPPVGFASTGWRRSRTCR